MRREEKVDRYEDALGSYLVRLTAKELDDKETRESAKCLSCLGNLERVSDHAVNLAELAQELAEKQVSFSQQAEQELQVCIAAVQEITLLTRAALAENDLEKARQVEPLEEVIDALTKELKARHIQRVQEGRCTLELGFVFNDCVNNFERVADHCSNIAIALLEADDPRLRSHEYLRMYQEERRDEYQKQLLICADKYYDVLFEEKHALP